MVGETEHMPSLGVTYHMLWKDHVLLVFKSVGYMKLLDIVQQM
jgi:hypothetical protein